MSESISDDIETKLRGAVVNGLLAILVGLVRPIATLTEVFFRKRMGERYFSGWNIIVGFAFIFCFRSPLWLGKGHSLGLVTNIIAAAWAAGMFFCVYLDRKETIERYEKGARWHSYCYGVPRWAEVPVYAEKVIPLAVGILLMVVGLIGMGGLLFLSGGVSLLLRYHEARLAHDRMLDMIDAQIEHEHFAEAVMESRPTEQLEGLRVSLPKRIGPDFRQKYVRKEG
ncbi:MAG TPA: hypothetical protein VLI39_12765 [Sedimentisphaerales bacterium]|nr:hypothetical protein [Sedimentisphaerales bacterium]